MILKEEQKRFKNEPESTLMDNPIFAQNFSFKPFCKKKKVSKSSSQIDLEKMVKKREHLLLKYSTHFDGKPSSLAESVSSYHRAYCWQYNKLYATH